MITVKITRLNDVDPLIQVLTNTGLPPIHPDDEKIEEEEKKIKYENEEVIVYVSEPKSITLQFNNINRIVGDNSKLMNTIGWYIRTYFTLTTKFEILISQHENS